MLATPSDRNVMTRTPRKNEDLDFHEDFFRITMHFIARNVPSAIFVILTFQFILGISLQGSDLNATHTNTWLYYITSAPVIYIHPRPPAVVAAIDRAEGAMLFAIGLCCIVFSAGHLYRTESILDESPLRNRTWLATSIVLLFAQV